MGAQGHTSQPDFHPWFLGGLIPIDKSQISKMEGICVFKGVIYYQGRKSLRKIKSHFKNNSNVIINSPVDDCRSNSLLEELLSTETFPQELHSYAKQQPGDTVNTTVTEIL